MRLENLVLSLWVGSMVGIGYIAAPVLFKMLDDRQLAGALAGQMFKIVSIGGLILGLLLVLSIVLSLKHKVLGEWRFWLLTIMLALVGASLFVIQPMMADLKAGGLAPGSDLARKFGMMHGVSSVMYLITTLSGMLLLFLGLRSSRIRLSASDIHSL